MNDHLVQTQFGDSEALASGSFAGENTTNWLASVSNDLSRWHIFEYVGNTRLEKLINLNVELVDGSMLTDAQNSELFNITVEYLKCIRLYLPDLSVISHRQRISDLLTFYLWLSQRRVRSLQSVTRDHIELYTEAIVYGKEWAIEAPHRLVRYLQCCYKSGQKLPKYKHYKYRLARGKIYQAAEIRGAFVSTQPICAHIIRRVEKTGLTEELTLPILDFVGLCGYTLRPNTVQSVRRILAPIEDLWEWKHQLPKPNLRFRPFPRGASKVADRLGRITARYKTIPPQIAIALMSEALKWVIEFSPIILRGVDRNWNCVDLTNSLSTAGLKITVNDKGRRGINSRIGQVDRDGLIRLLAVACFIVIASFSARRLGEILELGAGRCKLDSRGHYWLETYIEKTDRQYQELPVPKAVNKAIECMEVLSETARQVTNRDCIWQFRWFRDEECRVFRPQDHLNQFTRFCPSLSEIEWRFAAHQFRRFFAIAYFWWYERGDVVALAHYLRHHDLEMTKRYVTDKEFGKLWKDVQDEQQAEFVRSVVYGTRSVGGKAGQRLKQLISKYTKLFRKEVEVLSVDHVVGRILRLARKLGTPFKLHIWGTVCACPRKTSFAKHANCKGAADAGPDFKNATEELCGTCPFAIHTSAYISSAKSALTDRRNLTSGLTQGSLIHEFAASSCTSLERIIEKGETFPL